MAGERKGKIYEALVAIALDKLVKKGEVKGPVHWNRRPSAMSIEPDFTSGSDPDAPDTVLLVNHSGSAGDSHKKFWRNIGELVEAKTVLVTAPRVYGITFGVIKKALGPIQENAFDAFSWVHAGSHAFYRDLDRFAGSAGRLPKGSLDDRKAYVAQILKNDSAATKAHSRLRRLLRSMYATTNPTLEKMWKHHRARTTPAAPASRVTHVRRGIGKLLLLDDISPISQLHKGKRVDSDSFPAWFYKTGFVRKFGDIAKLNDPEIAKVFDIVAFEDTEKIHRDAREVGAIRSLATAVASSLGKNSPVPLIVKSFSTLSSGSALHAALVNLHKNPRAILGATGAWADAPKDRVWLLEYLLEIVRLSLDGGYGFAQLGADVVASGVGSVDDLHSANQFGGGLGLSAWIARKRNSGFRADLLVGVANVLANKIAGLGQDSFEKLMPDLQKSYSNSVIEARLLQHRSFEPLWDLIRVSVPLAERVRILGCFREAAEGGGLSGSTEVTRVRKTLIKWQSCSDQGRDHKKKELCGRAIALRYQWNGAVFVRRPGVSKLVLLLDGTWRQDDLNSLLRAGWDEIFYPDEIDKLIKAIV
jgi:hypothetical protein